ncbi:hypothetical protein KSS87_003687 [Heliosperma pusillum]|nr:hypothetical protein KSS87_003687 [Heliosperma pusillum]
MHSEASSSHPVIGLSGSGALSHVYIQYPPLRCNSCVSKALFYDDGNKLLLSATSDQVFAWKIAPFDPCIEPTSDAISEGPVLSVRYSLDSKVLAIQRSNHEIQFWDKERGNTFCHYCRNESEKILGFFWTDCPTSNFVLVKTSGMDLLTCDSESKSLRLIESKHVNVSWYVYTHESRLLLLASGMQCKSFLGFQLSSAGIIRLPKFDMLMAKPETNHKPDLAAEDVHVITVYGRIYCFQVDRVAMQLRCYRFYRDAVVQQGSLPVYSSKVSVSVVDNVVLVHQVDAKVVILYDLFADSRAPISAPLPMPLRGNHGANLSSFQCNSKVEENIEFKQTGDNEMTLYKDGWTFLNPDLICDSSSGLLWKIHLDLEALSASNSDVPFVLEFLQRRKCEASKAKHLCLSLTRTIILEHRPVSVVARALDILITSYSHAIKTGDYFKGSAPDKSPASGTPHTPSPRNLAGGFSNNVNTRVIPNEKAIQSSLISDSESDEGTTIPNSVGTETFGAKMWSPSIQSPLPGPSNIPLDAENVEQHGSEINTAAVSPDEVYSYVFAPVDEEMAGDPDYLVALIIEFLRSASVERIRVYPNIYVLMIQLLDRGERYAELGSFIIDKNGYYQEALRYARKQKIRCVVVDKDDGQLGGGFWVMRVGKVGEIVVVTVGPSLFLEEAYASNDSQRLAAVLRFLSDFMPAFKSTPDHATYSHILNQMSASP